MEKRYIPVTKGGQTIKVFIDDVVYIERNRRKLRIVTEEKEYCYYEKIENVKRYLDYRFYECLSGCIINLEKVKHMKKQTITFFSGMIVIIGRDSFARANRKHVSFMLSDPKNTGGTASSEIRD